MDKPAANRLPNVSEGQYILPTATDFLRVLWKRFWIILLTVIVLTGTAIGFSLIQTPMYEASIRILIGQERGTSSEGLGGEVQGLQQLTQTMTEGVNSRPIAEAVIERHDLLMTPEEFLEDHLSVEQIRATQYIQVEYRDSSPERAQLVADSIGEVFSEQVTDVSPSANDVTAIVWQGAALPDDPVSPDLLLNIGLALAAGLMLGVGLAFLLEYLDDSWRSPEEAEQVSGVPNFGMIPRFVVTKENVKGDILSERLVTVEDPASAASEAYRTLRANLLYSFVDNPPRVIVLTSPGPQEGKSTTCANLGIALAQAGRSTVVLDCDLRRPTLHRIFGTRNVFGTVDILAGLREPQEVWHEPMPGLKVITVGSVPPNPAELLGSKRLSGFLAKVREEFDYVLIDAPPIGPVSDAAILGSQGDGVLLLLDAQHTRKVTLRQSLRSLEAVGGTVLGTIMNNVKASKVGYYYDGYVSRK